MVMSTTRLDHFFCYFSSVLATRWVDAGLCQHRLPSIAVLAACHWRTCWAVRAASIRASIGNASTSWSKTDPQESMTIEQRKAGASTMPHHIKGSSVRLPHPRRLPCCQQASGRTLRSGWSQSQPSAQARQEIGDFASRMRGSTSTPEGKMVRRTGEDSASKAYGRTVSSSTVRVLAGVIVAMPKDPVRIFEMLSTKYQRSLSKSGRRSHEL